MKVNNIFNGDYIEYLKTLDNNSVDFICIDPPYGKINGMILSGQKKKVDWDSNINWEEMFELFNKVLRPGGTMAVFGQQPTYSAMILSNLKQFKYELIWEKNNTAQGFHADKQPLNYTENIAIFVKNGDNRIYNKPVIIEEIDKTKYWCRWYAQRIQKFIGLSRRKIHESLGHRKTEFFFYFTGSNFSIPSASIYEKMTETFSLMDMVGFVSYQEFKYNWDKEKLLNKGIKLDSKRFKGTYSNILKFPKDGRPYYHPTQKPVKLMEELVKLYTNKGDLILDCFAGSGSTLVAAQNLERNFIGSEMGKEFYDICHKRLKK